MNEYKSKLNKYIKSIKDLNLLEIDEERLEFYFESFKDWSTFYSFDEVKEWFLKIVEQGDMEVEEIPLNKCKDWVFGEDKIYHKSGEFFTIKGLRVKTNIREAEKGWDQPIVEQTGYDGGILGILRKRFNGIPHYLLEAKCEPGNPNNFVQISPTLQATFSNINAVHLGNVPNYLQ